MLKDSSIYTLNEYIIELENQQFIGFYAPYYYIRFKENQLVMYLRKKETMELLKDDSSINSWLGLIDSSIDEAQCELYFLRDNSLFLD